SQDNPGSRETRKNSLYRLNEPQLGLQSGKPKDVISAATMLDSAVGNVEAALVGDGLERLGKADDGLGSPEHQKAIVRHLKCDPIEYGDFIVLIEIDEHVTTEHHIEIAQCRKIIKQIKRAELDHAAQFGRELPVFADLIEELHQQLDWQSALHLKLTIDT